MVTLRGWVKFTLLMLPVAVVSGVAVAAVSLANTTRLQQAIVMVLSAVIFFTALLWGWRHYVGPLRTRRPTLSDLAVVLFSWMIILVALYLSEASAGFRPFFHPVVLVVALLACFIMWKRRRT
jgi:hypothetical protein